jgi:NTP pyrophosphatase (non-canonical NTP hydrolase)
MEINEYQKAALRTANSEMSDDLILNGILGLCGETGEVSDHIKKYMFQGHELDKEKLVNELGDVCWYIAILASGLNVDLETVMKKNIEKLQRRYPDGFDTERSLHRPQGED